MLNIVRRALVAAGLLVMASGAWAQAGGKAYYGTFCPGQPDCTWSAQELNYSLPSSSSQYVTLGTMSLPAGKYMVTAKMTSYVDGSKTSAFNLECALFNSADSASDWTDIAFQTPWASGPLFFEIPVSFGAGGGSVGVKCRGMGHQDANPSAPAQFYVWGGKIAAVQVSSITLK
jgi:hypothetical protein